MVGGRSESSGKLVLEGRHLASAKIAPAILEQLKNRKFLTVGAAHSLAESDPASPDGPFVSHTVSEVRDVEMDGFVLGGCELRMTSSHGSNNPFPNVTFGKTAITGLKLGGSSIEVHLDTDAFNSLPTQADFLAHCSKNGATRDQPFSSFQKDAATGRLHQNQSAYLVGSLVKKIEGRLPQGASLEDNGYIIDWPGFGKIILGEILIGPYVRRVTLVRLKHSDVEIGSGCSGGSTWP